MVSGLDLKNAGQFGHWTFFGHGHFGHWMVLGLDAFQLSCYQLTGQRSVDPIRSMLEGLRWIASKYSIYDRKNSRIFIEGEEEKIRD